MIKDVHKLLIKPGEHTQEASYLKFHSLSDIEKYRTVIQNYITEAIEIEKKSETRIERIERLKSKILQGKGIHDCTCGLSKKVPSCDGSHKTLK